MAQVLKLLKGLLTVLVLVILGYSPVFYFNVYEDPYSIFTSDFSERRIEPNNHFIKMRYVLNNKKKFDSFIFGNSRANNLNPKLFTNGKYYNMYYSLGVPDEFLKDIRLLLKQNIKTKNIVLLLDFSSYTTNIDDRSHDMLRHEYPEKNLDVIKYYIHYAFQIPDEKFKEEYYKNNPSAVYAKIFETGQAENAAAEEFIKNNTKEHINDPKFNSPHIGYHNRLDITIKNLDTIRQICNDHKIALTFVMNPIHKTTWKANNLELYCEFLNKLSSLSDFYDFSGINKVTSNNFFYYETSHFRPIVGDAMARYIQYKSPIDTIPDFGMLVTKYNVSERIQSLKSQN